MSIPVQINLTSLANALGTVQRHGLPIERIDFDPKGSFRVHCGLSPIGFAMLEIAKIDKPNYLFGTVEVFEAVQVLLKHRLQIIAREITDPAVIVEGAA